MRFVLAGVAALLAVSTNDAAGATRAPTAAIATAPAIRIGVNTPEGLIADLFPNHPVGAVVFAFADLEGGGMVPVTPDEWPDCGTPAPPQGSCVLIDADWSEWSIARQRSLIAHEWGHVLAYRHRAVLVYDECLADEIGAQALAAAGFAYVWHYVCPDQRVEMATEVLSG